MLDVTRSRELQAALLGVRQAERDVVRDINKTVRGKAGPVWSAEISRRASGPQDSRVLVASARVNVGAQRIRATAANSGRKLSGGLQPRLQWQGVEFGMTPRQQRVEQRSRSGRRYSRSVQVGDGLPRRVKHGRVVFPASSALVTTVVRIWVTTVVDSFRSFADIKSGG